MPRRKKKNQKKSYRGRRPHPKSLNLYKFIKLILGENIPDYQIAARWKMDIKNFHEFKVGKYPVPRLKKLEQLASVLGVNKHLVFQVGGGTSARKVFDLIRRNDLRGQLKLLSGQLNEAHTGLVQSEKRYRDLFQQANDAIFVIDPQTETFIDCNKQAEHLMGYSRDKLIGAHYSTFIPPERRKLYKNPIKKFVAGKGSGIKTHRALRADGTIIPLSISRCVVELDDQQVVLAICRDASHLNA